MQFVHKSMCSNRWHCVSLEEKAHLRATWRRNLSKTPMYEYYSYKELDEVEALLGRDFVLAQ